MEKSNLDYNKSYHTFHTRDYFRGKSFRYASVWTMGAHYDSDDYNIDFVIYGPVLLACKQSHKASIDNEPKEYIYDVYGNPTDVISSYWDFVLCGIRGKDPGIRINPNNWHWEISDDRLDTNAEWRDTGVKAKFEYEDMTDDDKRDLASHFITQELVLEFASASEFPQTGETGKIYIATSTNQTYRWSGSVYVLLSSPVDDALSSTSSNPVENRVIKAKLDSIDTDIVNLRYQPDENDITADINKKLMFKDKVYNSTSPNGLGYKYLRSNIVNDKNVLTQAMINLTNTIYRIDEDYDLNSGSITFTSGTVLDVHGGSIKNGTVNLNGVKFLHPVNWDTFFINCIITGVPSPDTIIFENESWKFYDNTGVKRRFMTEPDS